MKMQRTEVLPSSLPPLGINREQAAALVGISVSLFDKAMEVGTMPRPRVIGGRLVYDVAELAEAFRKLPHKAPEGAVDADGQGGNPWDA